MVQRVVEHPVRVRRGKVYFPPIAELEAHGKPVAQDGEWKAVLTCKEGEVAEFLEWIEMSMCGRVRVRGVFAFEVLDFRTDREFRGLVVYFRNTTDAVHFRLAWSDYYVPEQAVAVAA